MCISEQNDFGSGGIRTHAPEETGALNQRLRPLGHATFLQSWETWMYQNCFLSFITRLFLF